MIKKARSQNLAWKLMVRNRPRDGDDVESDSDPNKLNAGRRILPDRVQAVRSRRTHQSCPFLKRTKGIPIKSKVQGLIGGCLASVVLLMSMGLLLTPSPVQAQNKTPKCVPAGGIMGCYSCATGGSPSSPSQGCTGTTTVPAGWSIGSCYDMTGANTCATATMNCGAWQYCSTKKPSGQNCTVFPLCL